MFDQSGIGVLDRPADDAFFAEVEEFLRETLGDAEYERINSEQQYAQGDDE